MLTWNICREIFSESPAVWDTFTTQVLGENPHPGRRKGFQLSREALRLCFSELGMKKQIQELLLEGHGRLKHFNEFVLSLSHTSELGAAVIAPANEFRSVGIDLENKSRVVKPDIIRRISHPQDLHLSNLELWTLKEAAFKASMNTGMFTLPIEFSSIQLKKDEWEHSPSGLSGAWQLIEEPEFQMALTWIRA